VKLRRKNRIRTVQATLAIEGSTLEEAQVTAIFDGKRVLGPRAEIREVKNAIVAYDQVLALDPGSVREMLLAHGVLMQGLVDDAGRFRAGGVGVVQGRHVAPPASRVAQLVKDLLEFVAKDDEVHPLVKAAATHYEIEFIHPFTDGNGRIGRLWHHRILWSLHPVFEHVPVESVIAGRQSAYYAALGESDRAGGRYALPALLTRRDPRRARGIARRAPPRAEQRRLATSARANALRGRRVLACRLCAALSVPVGADREPRPSSRRGAGFARADGG
jgi:Fic family protein